MKTLDPEKELIKHTKRKGGPFDTIIVPKTKCLDCGASFEKPLRWHYNRNSVCPKCKGQLDPKPMTQQILELLKKCKVALNSVNI